MDCCETCKYWDPDLDDYGKPAGSFGRCRRYPPCRPPPEGAEYPDWQHVTTDPGDWCGEFAPA
jgi:hypothetical protein